MKKLLILFYIMSSYTFANEEIVLPKVVVEVRAKNAMEKVQAAVRNPENILKRYQPQGFIVKNKIVRGNYIEFSATKKVIMVTHTVQFRGTLTMVESGGRKINQVCYDASMDLGASDDLIRDNISELFLKICVNENNKDSITAIGDPKLIKGNQYNSVVGPIVRDMVIAQINPVISAVKEEIEH